MDLDIAFELLELATSIVKQQAGVGADSTLGDILTEIVHKAAQAYHDCMGEPIDLYLLEA